MSNLPHIILILILITALGGCRDSGDRKIKAIVGATLIDGTGAPPLPDAVVVIDGSRIRAAGPRAMVPIPQDSERIDARGKWVVPASRGSSVAAGQPADLLILSALSRDSSTSGKIDRALRKGRWVPADWPTAATQ
jgi:hypothetical protein